MIPDVINMFTLNLILFSYARLPLLSPLSGIMSVYCRPIPSHMTALLMLVERVPIRKCAPRTFRHPTFFPASTPNPCPSIQRIFAHISGRRLFISLPVRSGHPMTRLSLRLSATGCYCSNLRQTCRQTTGCTSRLINPNGSVQSLFVSLVMPKRPSVTSKYERAEESRTVPTVLPRAANAGSGLRNARKSKR